MAEEENFTLGVKAVRGAYIQSEVRPGNNLACPFNKCRRTCPGVIECIIVAVMKSVGNEGVMMRTEFS